MKDFFSSEKGVFGYLLPLAIATAFVFMGRITETEWMEFALVMAGIYTGGKAIQGSAAAVANGKAAKAELEELKSMLVDNDEEADDALEEKFEGKE